MTSRTKQLLSFMAVFALCLGLAAMPSYGRRSKKSKKSAQTSAQATQPNTATNASAATSSNMVWVNTRSKVFHVKGDRYYGKTKNGKYMTEAEAIKQGYHEAKRGGHKKASK